MDKLGVVRANQTPICLPGFSIKPLSVEPSGVPVIK